MTRRFAAHVAVDAVSLAIEPGESFALLGANGAGKTTLIRLVIGTLVPTSGRVTVDGLCPISDARAVHARLGYVAETSRLYPDLPVRSFLRFAARVHGLAGTRREEAVDRALDRFELAPAAGRLIGHLSKGLQQRVSLAQAFLHEPSLLVADEPSSGLDPYQQEEVRDALRGLSTHCTVLICTHDLAEARALASRVAVMRAGRIAALGPTAEVLGAGAPLELFRATEAAAR